MGDLSVSVVLVTGCSSGIGLATAIHFAQRGHDVHAGVRNLGSASALTDAIAAGRLSIRPVTLDVDDPGTVNTAVEEVLDRSGRIDVLVNNAGISGGGPIADVPLEWAQRLFETNYFGVWRVTRVVLPGMSERRHGAIVNVSSITGRVAFAGHGHYCAVKHALEAASEALAQEVIGLGIRVALVEPGLVQTSILGKAQRFENPAGPYFVHLRRIRLQYEMQRPYIRQPEDVARVIYEAATTETPRLRYVVGEDARRLIAGRAQLTDEEYVAAGLAGSDEDYASLLRERYGFE
jgi:NAD(P)-dependent dehydrogenase (short-subunit alcohol dehydrogenase family)